MSINISGLTPVDDPSYRYKMPRIIPKVEGRGNGIKTVLVNVVEVGQSLNREPAEITKFFGFELGAQTSYGTDDRAIVNGSHSPQDLQALIHKYIELFVLCKECRLPETNYKIKGEEISQKCLACGNKSRCDMTHKLTTFILKNHKKVKADTKDADKKKEKKSKEEKSESKDAVDDEEAAKEKKAKKEKKKKDKEKKKKEGSDDDLPEETDKEIVDAAIEQLRQWSLNDTNKETIGHGQFGPLVEELRNIQTLSTLKPSERMVLYLGAYFDQTAIATNAVEKHKQVLASLAPNDIQRRSLIAAAEWFCGVQHPELLRMFPVMLKQLYDADLIEEDVFYSWHTDYDRNDFSINSSLINIDTLEALKAAAKPFITWLQEAAVEGEEDDEEADDDEEEEEDGEGEEEEA